MPTEMITLKLEDRFLRNIDIVVEQKGFQSRTEFIRNALRDKLENHRIHDAIIQIANLKGASKKKTTDKDFEGIRQKAFEEISRRLK